MTVIGVNKLRIDYICLPPRTLKIELVRNAASFKILYADDDSDDCFFLTESLQQNGIKADMVCVSNGEEALDYLTSDATAGNMPSLIILDLNMPKMDGKKTLGILKSHPHFSSIPVVILSTSANTNERDYCTQNGAASYLVKPNHLNGYTSLVTTLRYLM